MRALYWTLRQETLPEQVSRLRTQFLCEVTKVCRCVPLVLLQFLCVERVQLQVELHQLRIGADGNFSGVVARGAVEAWPYFRGV